MNWLNDYRWMDQSQVKNGKYHPSLYSMFLTWCPVHIIQGLSAILDMIKQMVAMEMCILWLLVSGSWELLAVAKWNRLQRYCTKIPRVVAWVASRLQWLPLVFHVCLQTLTNFYPSSSKIWKNKVWCKLEMGSPLKLKIVSQHCSQQVLEGATFTAEAFSSLFNTVSVQLREWLASACRQVCHFQSN